MRNSHHLLIQKQRLEAEWASEYLANGSVSLQCVRLKEKIKEVERQMRNIDEKVGSYYNALDEQISIAT